MKLTLSAKEIQKVAQIGSNQAIERKNEVNAYTISKGIRIFNTRTCLVNDFCELYGFAKEDIERIFQQDEQN